MLNGIGVHLGEVLLKTILFLALAINALPSISSASAIFPAGSSAIFPQESQADFACSDFVVSGQIDFGGAVLHSIKNIDIRTQGAVNAAASTVHLTGNWSNTGTFLAGSSSLIVEDGCGSTVTHFTGASAFNNLTLQSTTGKPVVLIENSVITVNNSLQAIGSPDHILTVSAQNGGRMILSPSAQFVSQDANFMIPLAEVKNPVSVPTTSQTGLILLIVSILSMAIGFLKFSKKQ